MLLASDDEQQYFFFFFQSKKAPDVQKGICKLCYNATDLFLPENVGFLPESSIQAHANWVYLQRAKQGREHDKLSSPVQQTVANNHRVNAMQHETWGAKCHLDIQQVEGPPPTHTLQTNDSGLGLRSVILDGGKRSEIWGPLTVWNMADRIH